jgi:hypothetical protein
LVFSISVVVVACPCALGKSSFLIIRSGNSYSNDGRDWSWCKFGNNNKRRETP